MIQLVFLNGYMLPCCKTFTVLTVVTSTSRDVLISSTSSCGLSLQWLSRLIWCKVFLCCYAGKMFTFVCVVYLTVFTQKNCKFLYGTVFEVKPWFLCTGDWCRASSKLVGRADRSLSLDNSSAFVLAIEIVAITVELGRFLELGSVFVFITSDKMFPCRFLVKHLM